MYPRLPREISITEGMPSSMRARVQRYHRRSVAAAARHRASPAHGFVLFSDFNPQRGSPERVTFMN